MMFQNLHRMMAEAATLKIECDACKRRIERSRDEAFRRLGPDATPSDVRRRLFCGGCGGCGTSGWARVWI